MLEERGNRRAERRSTVFDHVTRLRLNADIRSDASSRDQQHHGLSGVAQGGKTSMHRLWNETIRSRPSASLEYVPSSSAGLGEVKIWTAARRAERMRAKGYGRHASALRDSPVFGHSEIASEQGTRVCSESSLATSY